MEKNEVEKKVIEAIIEVQEMSGRTIEGINSGTKPMGGIEGFDSMNGVEVTVILSESLGYDIPTGNLFVSEDGKRTLSISEISDEICKIKAETDNK